MRVNQPTVSRRCRERLPSLLILLLTLTMTACGGAYSATNAGGGGGTGGGSGTSVASVTVNPLGTPSIAVSASLQLQALGSYPPYPSQAKDLTNSATWSTSNPAVATVNQGLVTGTGTGSVTITATFGGLSGSTRVVVGLTPTSMAITPIGTWMFSKSATPKQWFYATATYSDGSTLDLTDFVTWSSSPRGVASFYIYDPGEATFVGTGTTTIVATLDTEDAVVQPITVVP
jgi:Bacterial Ig-like domain (group 2)